MFKMFVVGFLFGAVVWDLILASLKTKPNPFTWSITLLLMLGVASIWAISSRNADMAYQYQQLNGKGDGL